MDALLPYKDEVAPFGVLDSIKGYGYDMEEIIRYYDVTDGSIEADDEDYIDSILSDLSDLECDSCNAWMNELNYEDGVESMYRKYNEQVNNIPTTQQQQYIDQFILLLMIIGI
ncbi:MAG: hypothetical protein IPL12_08060 [Bacteroidetes bacterium]|nr:hypothetical protein [Bacteroidota bacterium]